MGCESLSGRNGPLVAGGSRGGRAGRLPPGRPDLPDGGRGAGETSASAADRWALRPPGATGSTDTPSGPPRSGNELALDLLGRAAARPRCWTEGLTGFSVLIWLRATESRWGNRGRGQRRVEVPSPCHLTDSSLRNSHGILWGQELSKTPHHPDGKLRHGEVECLLATRGPWGAET